MRKHDCHHTLCRANVVSLQAHKSVNNVIEHEERTAREINIEVPYARIQKKTIEGELFLEMLR